MWGCHGRQEQPGKQTGARSFALTVLLLCAAAGAARADVCFTADRPGPVTTTLQESEIDTPLGSALPTAAANSLLCREWESLAGARSEATLPCGPHGLADASVRAERPALELPPAPSSISLALSGLLTLGAWQLVRSVRHVHLDALPVWYHTGGPAQVGCATVYDFQLAGPLWQDSYALPRPYQASTAQFGWREWDLRRQPQYTLRVKAPRAPPPAAS